MIERGEAGDGSLEPGIASGEEFVIANTNLFLKYYYDANPEELDPGHPSRKRKEADVPEQAGDADEAAADGAEPGCNRREKDRSPVFLYLDRVEGIDPKRMCTSKKAGQVSIVYKCNIYNDNGRVCGCRVTTYARSNGRCETTSNAYAHFRLMAEKGDEVCLLLAVTVKVNVVF